MDISCPQKHLLLLSTMGFSLTTEQRIRLRMAHTSILTAHPHLDEVKFWGKIEGTTRDYYILMALQYTYAFPHKTFFYTQKPDLEFKPLPQLLLHHMHLADTFNAVLFTGDPTKVLKALEETKEEGKEEDPKPTTTQDNTEAKETPQPLYNFTELHRLSYVVHAIEFDTQCIPIGSYTLTPQHQLRPFRYFQGLNEHNATLPTSWLHFRAPQTQEIKLLTEKDTAIFEKNISETLQNDYLSNKWSLQLFHSVASVRSLLWQGYYALHRVNTAEFCGVYIGEGIKNVDLPFMI